MSFSQKVKFLRKSHGYSQEQLAKKLFVSRAAIAKWETSNVIPHVDSLIALSKIFDISIDELLSEENKKRP